MKKILIRTNFDEKIGLGHIMRMFYFASYLKKKKFIIYLALDRNINKFSNFLRLKFSFCNIIYIYDKTKFKNQLEDANKIKKIVNEFKITHIIIDDYRIDKIWEKFFFKKQKIIVFSDLDNKKHLCDFIIDSRWLGKFTHSRYTENLPKVTKKLLGPKYAIINHNLKKTIKNKKFIITFYLGGGGNFNIIKNTIISLSKLIKEKEYKNILIYLIVGPTIVNFKKKNLKKKHIRVVKNSYDISKILQKTSFFVGVSSSIIYELNYLGIPSLIFPTTSNQINKDNDLEDMGFYFNMEKSNLIYFKKISHFILQIYHKYIRIKKLTKKRKIKVDNKGVERIYSIIFKNKKIFKKIIFKDPNYNSISIVGDNLINYYLNCRNLKSNRDNSVNRKLIKKIDHYLWWFLNNFKHYYFAKNNKIIIFLSHKLIKRENYFIGSWFKTFEKVSILDILKVLNWQLKNIKKKYKWLAIIKKSNKLVFKINTYLKFKKINPIYDSKVINFLVNHYKIKNKSNYYFLEK